MAKKKLTKKMKKALQNDAIASVFIASLLLNVFFLSGVLLFASTNKLDKSVYDAAFNNLCEENYTDNLADTVEDTSDTPGLARMEHEIRCQRGDFEPYYQNAIEAYARDQN